jgi:hypothetical protein
MNIVISKYRTHPEVYFRDISYQPYSCLRPLFAATKGAISADTLPSGGYNPTFARKSERRHRAAWASHET